MSSRAGRALRVGVIPARLESTRLPRKLLLAESGRTLIEHTHVAAIAARDAGVLDRVVVATDSGEIAAVVRSISGEVVMTSRDCATGTDRVHEAAQALDLDDNALVVNIQGDEPNMSAVVLESVLGLLERRARGDDDIGVATHAYEITFEEAANPNLVKVVIAADGRALYFSRARIPYWRDAGAQATGANAPTDSWFGHAGVYAFTARALARFTRLPPSRLEQIEKLEQLRLLEAGVSMLVSVGERPGLGIDTRVDYDLFLERMAMSKTRRT